MITNLISVKCPKQFEQLIAQILKESFHFESIEMTPEVHDYGADILAYKGDDIHVIQVKMYNKQTVGIKAVGEAFSAASYYKSENQKSHCWVVTNSTFTKNAVLLAAKKWVQFD